MTKNLFFFNLLIKTVRYYDNRVINHHKLRNILSLALSNDEGFNWHPITIRNSIYPEGDIEYSNIPSEEYSYPAIIMSPDNNGIHVIYTFNRINLKFQLLTK